MAKFVIESPHTDKECLQALDETVKMGNIDKYVFGCKNGEHIAWAYVEADNAEDAINNNLPSFLRDNAFAHKVNKFSPEEIKAFHQ